MESMRQRTVMALAELLRGVTPANGYAYDLSQAVFMGKSKFGDGDPETMIAIMEPPISQDKTPNVVNFEVMTYTFQLVVQGFTPDADVEFDGCSEGYKLMAEVRRRIATAIKDSHVLGPRNIMGLGKRLASIKMDPGIVRPSDELSDRNYFWMILEFQISENAAQPYLP